MSTTTCPLLPAASMFFDGELSPSELDAMREHLAWCTACEKWLDFLVELWVLERPRKPLSAAGPRA